MVSFREVSVTDDAAHTLIAEYFALREQTFPVPGGYSTVYPVADQFVPPHGVFLVVEGDDIAGDPADIGCGGIRRLDPPAAASAASSAGPVLTDAAAPVRYEVKHLWLQPHTQGHGYGRLLLSELEQRARAFGADELVLDTNASLTAAGGLYRSSGFIDIPPYNDNRNATHWFGKVLATTS